MSSGKKDPIKIYEDPKASSTPEKKEVRSREEKKDIKDCEVQATVSMKEEESQVEEADTAQAKAEEFMYQEEHPPEYWKELAEKTREALEASLLENEELHTRYEKGHNLLGNGIVDQKLFYDRNLYIFVS